MFSQHDEEKCILENTPEHGRLLDVGAWSGEVFSNSRALILKGWDAVLVEPSSEPFTALINLYKGNRNVSLVNALAGFSWKLTNFYSTPDAISTTDPAQCQKWGGLKNFCKIIVPEVPLEQIATEYFDFITIDTEGSSCDLLLSIDLEYQHRKTNLVCVEHDGRMKEIDDYFKKFGFKKIYENGTNVIGKRA